MSHRVHPKVYRIRRMEDWDSRGFAKTPADFLEEDFRIREYLKKKLKGFGVEKVEIERFPSKTNIIISSARPGLIIGRGGEGIEQLRRDLEQKVLKKTSKPVYEAGKRLVRKTKKEKLSLTKVPILTKGKTYQKKELRIEIKEIKDPWTSAALIAQWVAQGIEKRIPHRRVLKQTLERITTHKEFQGGRVEISGRLNGAEIARREWLSAGKLPRQTLRADIDYAKAEAYCTYGVIGIKVWLYKGEKFE